MKSEKHKAYKQFNLDREKKGLPTMSRREFARLMALGSAGLSIPLVNSCGSEPRSTPDVPTGGQSGWGGQQGGSGAMWPGSGGTGGQAGAGTGGSALGGQPAGGSGGSPPVGGGAGGPPVGGQAGSGGAYDSGAAGTPPDSGQPDSSVPHPEADSGPADAGVDTGQRDSRVVTCPECAQVGISRDVDVVKSVRTAIDLAGGLSEIASGDTVVIKPNLTGSSSLTVTSVEVLRAIVQAVVAHTPASNITLAECTALGMDTRTNATSAGYIDLCEQEGINFLAFNEAGYREFTDPRWQHITDAKMVPESLNPMTFDHFINAPRLKNHEMVPLANAEYTCCMKNFVGILPYSGTGSRMQSTIHTLDLGEKAAELGCFVPTITMNVVDALRPALQNGPAPRSDADVADAGVIIASKDRVACDSLAVAVLKCYAIQRGVSKSYVGKSVWEQAQIRRGAELGLGVADPAKIEIIDSGVDNIADIKTQWV